MLSNITIKTAIRLLTVASIALLSACDFEVAVNGNGTVISDPAGIHCSTGNTGSCIVRDYERLGDGNDEVTTVLTAIPDPGYRLSHWRGCDKTYLLKCEKKMKDDIFIKAVFKPIDLATNAPNPGLVRFVAIGDFGQGNYQQKQVGDAMAQVCAQTGGCDFAIGLGDNIYDENPLDEYNDAFERKFEHPFASVDFPFYMSLGNHDNDLLIDGIGSFNHMGEVQVAYHYRNDRLSDKWRMPSRYYTHSHPQSTNPLAEFFVLDSSPFMSPLEINPEYWVLLYGNEQGDWARNAISKSQASWKIAYAHHPYISNGLHGNAGNYDGLIPLELISTRISGENYRRWFKNNICGKVDFYFAGHDHDLQFLHSIPECNNTMFLVSGTGAKLRDLENRNGNPYLFQVDNQYGFMLVELEGNTGTIQVYTVKPDNGAPTLTYEKTVARRLIP